MKRGSQMTSAAPEFSLLMATVSYGGEEWQAEFRGSELEFRVYSPLSTPGPVNMYRPGAHYLACKKRSAVMDSERSALTLQPSEVSIDSLCCVAVGSLAGAEVKKIPH